MTDADQQSQADRKEWYNEAEEALDRVGVALRAAWEASRESRMSALESAKSAAHQLGEAIDKGVAGAKERWTSSEEAAPAGEGQASGEEE